MSSVTNAVVRIVVGVEGGADIFITDYVSPAGDFEAGANTTSERGVSIIGASIDLVSVSYCNFKSNKLVEGLTIATIAPLPKKPCSWSFRTPVFAVVRLEADSN